MATRLLFPAAITVLVWAAAFPAIRIGLRSLDAVPLASLRFAIAGAVMALWLLWTRPSMPGGWDLLRFCGCGAIGISLYNILLNTGQQTVTAGAASFIINLQGVLTALLAMLFLGERFNQWAWFGTLICLTGTTLIAWGLPGGIELGAGATLVLGAAACSGVSFVLQRPLVAKYGAMTSAAINVLMGGLFLSPWLGSGFAQLHNASAESFVAVLFLGIFPGAIGYMSWMATLNGVGAARAANVLYLVPPMATAIAFFVADEVPAMTTIAGGCLVLAGVVVVNGLGRR